MRNFVLVSLVMLAGCGRSALPSRKVIVIGVDGMDPNFVERHWGELPHLARLRDRGEFSRLGTTTPPQSPVAWSTFSTGLDPDEHGIFDFVHRNAATGRLFLSTDRTEEPRFTFPLGPYALPLSGSRVIALRKGRVFWQAMAERKVPVMVVRMPANYPPVAAGQALSGMGTPDLRGTQSTFSFYTDAPDETSREVSGGVIRSVRLSNGHADLAIEGPPDSLRKDQRLAVVNVAVDVDPEQSVARIATGDQTRIVKQGEWSDWLVADFPLMPHAVSARGMFRVFAKQLHPGFELYVSPVNADPEKAVLPISAPAGFSHEVADEAGRYYTLGIPEDTSALRQGVFDLAEFLGQSHMVLSDEKKLLAYALRHYRGGFLFFYFSAVDQNAHMLWGKHETELLEVYREVDNSIGRVMREQPDAALMVMSDHGFATFDRAVNLNSWLRGRGFFAQAGASPGASVDWPKTEAYAVGLNGLYLNLAGREKQGIVSAERKRTLINVIREQLLAFRDPDNGRTVIETVEETRPASDNRGVAPDLIVGYARGYRGSWQTGLGEAPEFEIEENTDAWIADHCINAADVPGVLFTSYRNGLRNPTLKNLADSILALYGLAPQHVH